MNVRKAGKIALAVAVACVLLSMLFVFIVPESSFGTDRPPAAHRHATVILVFIYVAVVLTLITEGLHIAAVIRKVPCENGKRDTGPARLLGLPPLLLLFICAWWFVLATAGFPSQIAINENWVVKNLEHASAAWEAPLGREPTVLASLKGRRTIHPDGAIEIYGYVYRMEKAEDSRLHLVARPAEFHATGFNSFLLSSDGAILVQCTAIEGSEWVDLVR